MYTQMRVVLSHISSIAADIVNSIRCSSLCARSHPQKTIGLLQEKNQGGDVILEITTAG